MYTLKSCTLGDNSSGNSDSFIVVDDDSDDEVEDDDVEDDDVEEDDEGSGGDDDEGSGGDGDGFDIDFENVLNFNDDDDEDDVGFIDNGSEEELVGIWLDEDEDEDEDEEEEEEEDDEEEEEEGWLKIACLSIREDATPLTHSGSTVMKRCSSSSERYRSDSANRHAITNFTSTRFCVGTAHASIANSDPATIARAASSTCPAFSSSHCAVCARIAFRRLGSDSSSLNSHPSSGLIRTARCPSDGSTSSNGASTSVRIDAALFSHPHSVVFCGSSGL